MRALPERGRLDDPDDEETAEMERLRALLAAE
jgi:hypothetical protein